MSWYIVECFLFLQPLGGWLPELCARRVCGNSLWRSATVWSTCVVPTRLAVTFVPSRIWRPTSAWPSWMWLLPLRVEIRRSTPETLRFAR